MDRLKKILVAFALFGGSGCSVNILETFAKKDTDEALLYDAKMLINDGDYTGALTKFSAMSAEFLARREIKILRASAYGGVCGVDFLNIVQAITNIGATRVFPFMVSTFQGGSAARQSACISAENLIKSIAPLGANREPDENLLMAFIALGKVGAIISRYSDTAPANGTADAGFDPCLVGSIPSADAKEIATGLNIFVDSMTNSGTSLGGSVMTDLSTYVPTPTDVNTTDIDATEEKAVRTALNEDVDVGLGTNCTGDVVACACP